MKYLIMSIESTFYRVHEWGTTIIIIALTWRCRIGPHSATNAKIALK